MSKVTLDEFVKEIHKDIEKFKLQYLAAHEKAKAQGTEEYYPLEMEEDNSGLWFEFFMEFYEGDGV
jgi:phage head maturation protease